MRAFNEFSALWRAPIFQRAFYQDVGQNWKGIALRYLLLIQLICWLPIFIRASVQMSSFIDNDAKTALKEVPKVSVRGGRVSSPVTQPYILRDERGHPLVVLDTTGKTRSPTDVGVRLLITETTLVQVEPSGAVKTTPLTGFPDMEIDADWLISWVKLVRNLILPAFYPATVALCIVWRLLGALLLALFGLILVKPMGAQLSFGALMRLAAVSMTTVILLDTVVRLTGVPTACLDWLLYPAISMGYIVYAVKVNGDLTRGNEHSFPVDFPLQPLP